jgi:hypothetical protein
MLEIVHQQPAKKYFFQQGRKEVLQDENDQGQGKQSLTGQALANDAPIECGDKGKKGGRTSQTGEPQARTWPDG